MVSPPQDGDPAFEARVISLAVLIRKVWREIAQAFAAQVQTQSGGVTMSDAKQVRQLWANDKISVVLGHIGNTYLDGAGAVADAVGSEDQPVGEDLVQLHLDEVRGRLWGLGNDVWLDVRAQIKFGVDAGESVAEIAERVRNVAQVGTKQSLTIARTETHAAYEAGAYRQALFVGGGTKTWLATNDGKTRETHRLADGQAVPVDEMFTVGASALRFPGDPLGGPHESINCRCSVTYEFADVEADVLPVGKLSLVAAGKWNPTEHPRGNDGKFIKKGAVSNLLAKNKLDLSDVESAAASIVVKPEIWNTLTDEQKSYISEKVDKLPSSFIYDNIKKNFKKVAGTGGPTATTDAPSPKKSMPKTTKVSPNLQSRLEVEVESFPQSVQTALNAPSMLDFGKAISQIKQDEWNALPKSDKQLLKSLSGKFQGAGLEKIGKLEDNEYDYLQGLWDKGLITTAEFQEATGELPESDEQLQSLKNVAAPHLSQPTTKIPDGLKGKPGDPAKVTTGVIWGKHAPGTVVLENPDGSELVRWNGKKYEHVVNGAVQSTWTKKDAYANLKTDTHWVVPGATSTATPTEEEFSDVTPAPADVFVTGASVGLVDGKKYLIDTKHPPGTVIARSASGNERLVASNVESAYGGKPTYQREVKNPATGEWSVVGTDITGLSALAIVRGVQFSPSNEKNWLVPKKLYDPITPPLGPQLPEWEQELLDAAQADVPTPAPVTPVAPNLTFTPEHPVPADSFKKIGGQKGSNSGGTYEGVNGKKFYVKTAKSTQHASNEIAASALYRLAGVDVPQVLAAKGAPGLGSGLQTMSELVPNAKSDLGVKLNDPAYLKKIQDSFAVDAWLANWDVAGLGFDNIVTDANGDPHRIDVGGALLFRAQGAPKGTAFGDEVPEIDTLRDPVKNPKSAKLFAGMTDAEIAQSVTKVTAISDDQIDKIVSQAGLPSSVAARLKKRRDYLGERFPAPSAPAPSGSDDKTFLLGEAQDGNLTANEAVSLVELLTPSDVSAMTNEQWQAVDSKVWQAYDTDQPGSFSAYDKWGKIKNSTSLSTPTPTTSTSDQTTAPELTGPALKFADFVAIAQDAPTTSKVIAVSPKNYARITYNSVMNEAHYEEWDHEHQEWLDEATFDLDDPDYFSQLQAGQAFATWVTTFPPESDWYQPLNDDIDTPPTLTPNSLPDDVASSLNDIILGEHSVGDVIAHSTVTGDYVEKTGGTSVSLNDASGQQINSLVVGAYTQTLAEFIASNSSNEGWVVGAPYSPTAPTPSAPPAAPVIPYTSEQVISNWPGVFAKKADTGDVLALTPDGVFQVVKTDSGWQLTENGQPVSSYYKSLGAPSGTLMEVVNPTWIVPAKKPPKPATFSSAVQIKSNFLFAYGLLEGKNNEIIAQAKAPGAAKNTTYRLRVAHPPGGKPHLVFEYSTDGSKWWSLGEYESHGDFVQDWPSNDQFEWTVVGDQQFGNTVVDAPSSPTAATPTPVASPLPSAPAAPTAATGVVVPAYQVKHFKQVLKAEGNLGYWSKPDKIWDAVKKIQQKYPDPDNPGHSKYQPMDVLKALDKSLNTKEPTPFETKITKWAATYKGKQHIAKSDGGVVPGATTPLGASPKVDAKKPLPQAKATPKETYEAIKKGEYPPGTVLYTGTLSVGNALARLVVTETGHDPALQFKGDDGQWYHYVGATNATEFANQITNNNLQPGSVSVTAQKMGLDLGTSDITHLSETQKQSLYAEFKKQPSTYLSSPSKNIYAALKTIGDTQGLSTLQMIRVIDDVGAKKVNKPNEHLFEKKILDWLNSPQGAAIASGQPLPKPPQPKFKPGVDPQTQVPSFEASGAYSYNVLPVASAAAWYNKVKAKYGDWTASERSGLKTYTGGSYMSINPYLWGDLDSVSDTHQKAITGAQSGMRPSLEPVLLHRGSGYAGVGGAKSHEDILKLVGQTWKSDGFVSTSVGGKAAFGGPVLIEIEAPPGTPMAYVKPISLNSTENEMLLAAGLSYRIVSAKKFGGKTIVRMRVVPDPTAGGGGAQ